MKEIFTYAILGMGMLAFTATAHDVVWYNGTMPVTIYVQPKTDAVVEVALDMFGEDIDAVTGMRPQPAKGKSATIRVVQLDKASKSEIKRLAAQGFDTYALQNGTDAFEIKVIDGTITIAGGNGRGAAYGILEISRQAGVSPWVWWGDVKPEKKQRLIIDSDYTTRQSASVEKRGIFLNDEDWSLRPWSAQYEDAPLGEIGPKTYKKVFELLLRLRANAIWPAMHEGTMAFFKNPENKKVADSCGIYVGTSHCEPLLRNNVDEWDKAARGDFNYRTNRDNVQAYWTERLKEVSNSQTNMFTIGMRGIHDGSMEGYSTKDEKLAALQQVIDDQQLLISKYIGDPTKQMQVFVPYKEVLELYEMGLNVPETATLMWCDDNYGYITRLSSDEEQKRSGGGGVYYHLSYWGRPHDHLWLTTTQPGLIYHQMRQAYDHNVRKLWIANVHDPKAAAYDLSLFMDMAWDINSVDGTNIDKHLQQWLETQFGHEAAAALLPAMTEYYRLCAIRKPEFMGWSQVELDKKKYDRGLSQVRNTEFSLTEFGGELDRYIDDYIRIGEIVDKVGKNIISEDLQDAYFATIEYPVKSAALNAVKMLEAQRARQLANGSSRGEIGAQRKAIREACAKSQNAYYALQKLTERYNEEISDGKWRRSMDANPRHLPALGAPSLPYMLTSEDVEETLIDYDPFTEYHNITAYNVIARNADSYTSTEGTATTIKMLGHSMNAVSMDKDAALRYTFEAPNDGNANLTIALIPTQPNDNGDLRFTVSIDGNTPTEFSLKEPFRSEQWKVNVLRGQARRDIPLTLTPGSHTLEIKALDPNIVLDQWIIDFNPKRTPYYMIPVSTKQQQP